MTEEAFTILPGALKEALDMAFDNGFKSNPKVKLIKEALEIAFIKGLAAGVELEKNKCKYPECLENEDERCTKWLLGECKGPRNDLIPNHSE